MRYLLCAFAALVLAVPATAAKKPHHVAVTVTEPTVTLTAPGSYTVQRPEGPLTVLYVLTHRCWAGGVVVENDYVALPWYTDTDTTADLGPFPVSGEFCEAYLWVWPNSVVPVSNVVSYTP